MPQVDHITASSLNSFLFCSARWEFSRHEEYPQLPVDDDHMVFGKMVHQAIEDYYRKVPDVPRPVEIDARAKQAFADFVDVRSSQLKARYQICLSNFIQFELGRLKTFKNFKPDFVEHSISSGFIHGKIDAYWKVDQTLIDWKTGSFDNVILNDDYKRQGALYRRMLVESSLPCNRVLFVSLIHGKLIEIPVIPEAWLDNEINKMIYGRIYPNRGNWCKDCPYLLRCDFTFSEQPLGLWDI